MRSSCIASCALAISLSVFALPVASSANDGLVWQQTGVIIGTDIQGYFGESLARSGETLMVGARWDDRFEPFAGAVYVYERQAGVWVEVQVLAPADLASEDVFGFAIALDGDEALISAIFEGEAGLNAGAIYVFERIGGTWIETDKIISPQPSESAFGLKIDRSGDRFITQTTSQSAFVYSRGVGGWGLDAQVVPHPDLPADVDVSDVRIEGDRILITDSQWNVSVVGGAVFSLVWQGGAWTFEQRIESPTPSNNANFGLTAALHGDTLLVPSSRVRRFAVFDRDSGTWASNQDFAPPGESDCFGCNQTVLDANRVAVSGAYEWGASGNPNGPPGVVRTFVLDPDDGFVFDQTVTGISPEPSNPDRFGTSIALDGDEMIVGAPVKRVNGMRFGAVYFYERAPGPVLLFADGFESGDTSVWPQSP